MPSPRPTITIELPKALDADLDLRPLPPRSGVFVFEDEAGRTIVIGITGDLRRRVRARLAPPEATGPSRRIDYRTIVRTVRALTVGSTFEADWASLQLARIRLPHTCRSLFDRWCGWFVRCDPEAVFPRFVKVSTNEMSARPDSGVCVGPFANKHEAQRAIDRLESGFDLCRYHHILVEAPHATACAYKEMGRCPAPCDGSVTMEAYRSTIRDAIAFAADAGTGLAALERDMQAASERLDFERAKRLHTKLDSLRWFTRRATARVDRLDRFRFVAVLPSEVASRIRLMTVSGGRIEPWADVPAEIGDAALGTILDELDAAVRVAPVDLSPEGIETIGLVCWHRFRPAKARGYAELVPAADGVDRRALVRAVRRLRRPAATGEADLADTQLDG